jgi:hypothetical protein
MEERSTSIRSLPTPCGMIGSRINGQVAVV